MLPGQKMIERSSNPTPDFDNTEVPTRSNVQNARFMTYRSAAGPKCRFANALPDPVFR
jgi:hypothetical protein